jgi:hypothetical protein
MQRGRDHEQRAAHARRPRRNNTPPESGATSNTGGHGAEHAPTKRAAQHEADRHAREEDKGHFAAGVGGRAKAVNEGVVNGPYRGGRKT